MSVRLDHGEDSLSEVHETPVRHRIMVEINPIQLDLTFKRDQTGEHTEQRGFTGTIYPF